MPFSVSREDAEQCYRRTSSFLTDFYIDFLGSLVPGLFAVVLAALVFVPPAVVLCNSFGVLVSSLSAGGSVCIPPPLSTHVAEWKDIGLGPSGNIALLLVAAFTLGAIFYRQDPKVPDVRSAIGVWRGTPEGRRDELAVQNPDDPEAQPLPDHVEFPYLFLWEYLGKRGLGHLARWVPWRGSDPSTHSRRTKMFINILKIRLQFLVPERCREIIRNEAHVRMSSSMWYAAQGICSCWKPAVALAALAVGVTIGARLPLAQALGVAMVSVAALLLARLTRDKIELFVHYQRVRETVYVLETAHFAQESGFNLHSEDFASETSKPGMVPRVADEPEAPG